MPNLVDNTKEKIKNNNKLLIPHTKLSLIYKKKEAKRLCIQNLWTLIY